MLSALWRQPEYEGLAYYAFRGEFRIPHIEPADAE